MAIHAFVDETKAKDLLLAMTLIDSSEVGKARKALRGLLLPGQRRLHFHNEQNARRRLIIDALNALPIAVRLYTNPNRGSTGRGAAVTALAAELAPLHVERLVLEADEVQLAQDVAILTNATRWLRARTPFVFHHMMPSAEPLLWTSDAVAWCHARGGHWRTAVDPMVDAVIAT